MIVVMSNGATQENLDKVIDQIEALGYKADVEKGQFTNVVAVIGDTRSGGKETLEGLHGVERVIPIMKPYKHVSREFRKENTVIELPNGTKIGDNKITMMVGLVTIVFFPHLKPPSTKSDRKRSILEIILPISLSINR